MSNQELERQKYAALAYALGWTRSVLSDVLDGEFSPEQVRRIYDATATSRLAESIGLSEAELSVSFDMCLSESEKLRIQGVKAT